MQTQGTKNVKRSVITLIILSIIFFSPILLSWLTYKYSGKLDDKKTNNGTLIQPPLSISELNLYSNGKLLDNRLVKGAAPKVSPTSTNGKWMLVVVNPGKCDEQCEHNVIELRQMRMATGKNVNRVARAVLTFENPNSDQALQTLVKKAAPGTRVLAGNLEQYDNIMSAHFNVPYAAAQGTIYIVDPLGNIMMSYKPNSDPDGILDDLQRLLKVSQIG